MKSVITSIQLKKAFIVCLGLLLCLGLYGQVVNLGGGLLAISQTEDIDSTLSYNLFISNTFHPFFEKVNGVSYKPKDLQLVIQPSVSYAINKQVSILGGYTYQRNNPLTNDFINEHRFWQAITTQHAALLGQLSHRIKFEQRFIEQRPAHNYPLSTRLRYMIGYRDELGSSPINKAYYWQAYNEFFFSLTGNRNALYSENWAYLGIGKPIGKWGNLEVGYLLQTSVRNSNKDLQWLHLVQITWLTKFKLLKSF